MNHNKVPKEKYSDILVFLSMFRNITLERTLEFRVGILNSNHSSAIQNYTVLLTPVDIKMYRKVTEFSRHSDWIMLDYKFFFSFPVSFRFIYLKSLSY